MGLELPVEARATDPVPSQSEAAPPPPPALSLPVLLLLQIPGCESERLVQQLFVPLLGRLAPDAPAPAAGNASLATSHNASTAAAMCRVGGGQHWRERCFGEDGKLRPEVQLVTTPHLGVRHRARGETVLVVVLRHPIARLVAEFNARRFVEWRVPEPPRDPNASRADAGADDFGATLEQFRAVYRAHLRGRNPQACMIAGEPGHKCVPRLPRGPPPAAGTGTAAAGTAGTGNATRAAEPPPPPPEGEALQRQWARRAARRLEASHVVIAERFEAGKRALCRALATPRSGGGQGGLGASAELSAGAEFSASAAAACPACSLCSELARQVPLVAAGEGNHLTLKHLASDADLLAEIAEAEAIDLQLYRRQLKALAKASAEDEEEGGGANEDGEEGGGESGGGDAGEDEEGDGDADGGGGGARATKAAAAMAGAPSRSRRRNSSSSGAVSGRVAARACTPTRELCTRAASLPGEVGYAAPRRRWADEYAARVATLQRLAPPKRDHALLFTHIPKCGGSSFRNALLLEFTRVRRAPRDFGCVFYRDVHFVEQRRENSSLTRHGPECLGPDGMLPARVKVVTGHIGFQPSLLARFQGRPFTAVVLLREPLERLVSLFNMYPDGTWGKSETNHSPALNFAAAYRRRLRGRNALVCFVSGATLCDSIGALEPRALGGASLRLARYNLLHRYAVFGLVERAEESQIVIAWSLGWLDFYLAKVQGHRDTHLAPLAPGASHRRLALAQLCQVPGLLQDMQRGERLDLAFYAFAQGLYAQRLRDVPEHVLRHLPPPPPPPASAVAAATGCPADGYITVPGLVTAEDAALLPDD